jgi:hypothetical protein
MTNKGQNKKVDLLSCPQEVNEDKMYLHYKKANIIREHVEVFNHFSKSLIYMLHNSYLGSMYIKSNDDINGHYNWCYNNICEKFYNTLNFNFLKNKNVYDYC